MNGAVTDTTKELQYPENRIHLDHSMFGCSAHCSGRRLIGLAKTGVWI